MTGHFRPKKRTDWVGIDVLLALGLSLVPPAIQSRGVQAQLSGGRSHLRPVRTGHRVRLEFLRIARVRGFLLARNRTPPSRSLVA